MNEPATLCDGGAAYNASKGGCHAHALSNLTARHLQPLDQQRQAGYRGFQRQKSRVTHRRLQTEKFFNEKFLGKIEGLNEQYRNYHAEVAGGEKPKANTTWYKRYGNEDMKENSTYFLPFTPQAYDLDNRTLALNASGVFSNGTGQNVTRREYRQYDTHSLYGH